MKITENKLRITILIIGLMLIGLGLAKKFFNFPDNPQMEQNIGTVLFIAAALLFVWVRKLKMDRDAEQKKQEEEKKREQENGRKEE